VVPHIVRQKFKVMKKLFFLTVAAGFSVTSFAQFSISGTIKDSLSEPVPGATVRIVKTYKGVNSDNNGFYKLKNLEAGDYQLEVSFVGYQTQTYEVKSLNKDVEVNFELKNSTQQLNEVIVSGTRVGENSPIAHTNISSKDLEKNNLGQDIPFLLQNSVSMVSTSDAGAGVGYTGFRLRGSDATRINVTINGIPVNDAESQGTFWVNMPDLASSTENIQIQRGVGSSTNGAGAFGGSVNMQTNTLNEKAYGELVTSYGSFNTQKYTAKLGTGLLNGKWAFDGRASYIKSDGYIDRASSDLKSYYVSSGYYGKKTIVKAIHFAGHEKTYQSWWGTPESRITGNKKAMETHAANNYLDSAQTHNLLNSGRTYNYYEYDNEIDNYNQDHYQLHITNQFNDKLSGNISFHYTYGRGYYEQFRQQDDFADYGLDDLVIGNDTITSTDLIRRRWLDNDFYGTVYHLNYKTDKLNLTIGGGYNIYDGDHFGEIIWSEFANGTAIRDRYYDNNGFKTDLNTYLKADYLIGEKLTVFADLQVRMVDYSTKGIDSDLRKLSIDTNFVFFNPKAGLNYQFTDKLRTYVSIGVGNREPVRNDFIDNAANLQPKHETLIDYEFGVDFQTKKTRLQTNFYYMDYTNQLVLTGELNDVGSSIRKNVDKSYRSGVELIANVLVSKRVAVNFNTTLSQNKINSFTEVLYDYTNGFDVVENNYSNTDIAFSPNVISALGVEYTPVKSLNLMLQGKYVAEQFLDNSSNAYRTIDAYYTVDARVSYTLFPKKMKELTINFMANNILNNLYSSNGYTYGYIVGDLITENFFYPQAGANFLVGLTAKF
jgi:iron complex outermembrane receptor protein